MINCMRTVVMSQLIKKFCNLSEYFSYQIIRLHNNIPIALEKFYADIAMYQRKELSKTYKNANVVTSVLGSGALGAPSSLFLTTDHCNYIFNCGEGSQRIAQEHRLKLAKIENIFITNCNWKNIGGLTGLLLTMQTYVSEINIHSSEEIIDFINASHLFACFPKLKFNYISIDESKPFKDSILTVWYIPTYKTPEDTESTSDINEEPQCHSNDNGKRVIDTSDIKENITDKKKKLKSNKKIFSYICEILPRRGKLIVSHCEKLGVTIGPQLKLLKDGYSITTEDGTIVNSSDVCMPNGSKDAFIVIDCPEEEYLESIIKNPKLLNMDDYGEIVVYHFTPAKVFNHPEYQKWIQTFADSTQHVILNEENTCLGSEGVYKQQYLLNMLHPEIFPPLSKDSLIEESETKLPNVHRGKTMHSIRFRPSFRTISKDKIVPQSATYKKQILQNYSFLEALSTLQEQIKERTTELGSKSADEYPQIVMLGTGSSAPNKIRNTSGILLRVDEHHNIILDCSEGTLCQIIRLFGESEAKKILANIKAIFISHKHADHHIGVTGILQERQKYTTNKVYLLVPIEIITWLNIYNTIEPISHLCNIVNNTNFIQNNKKKTMSFQNIFNQTLNIKCIDTNFVKHCKNAFGVAITLNDGTKIVYSGDAMPSNNLIEIGKDCDLLIHEATMEDELLELAKLKMHSTTSEAINIGISMNAKFTLLTHFSQRYSKISEIPEDYKNVGLAYDNMIVTLSQLPLLHLFYPCFKEMFNEYYDETIKRKTKKKSSLL